MKESNGSFKIDQYFAGLAENTFLTRLGVFNPPLVDYLTNLLVRFVRNDSMHQVRSVTGKPILTVTEMAAEATQRLGTAKRTIHRHIGDFTLFWAGVYPESIKKDGDQVGEAHFETFCRQGKKSYQIAAEIRAQDSSNDSQQEVPSEEILFDLSEKFDLWAYGLREVRRQWESGEQGEGGMILLN